ncbi:MAG: fibronectin type III domain-containing protein [Candidatus Shapirobacteria bacterium]
MIKFRFKLPIKKKVSDYFFAPRFYFSRFQFNLIAVLFISIGLATGTYLTMSKVILPSIFAVSQTSNTLNFDVGSSGNYNYDTSSVTIGASGVQPIATNKFSNSSFATNSVGWTSDIIVPNGYVKVPGNSTFSTTDFAVMKYEAKCASTSDPATGLTSPTFIPFYTYKNNVDDCISANNKQVVSVANGYPIALITQPDAITKCASVSVSGATAHLINNNEWMTIARNAEAQNTNWSLGAVGSGYLYAGNNNIDTSYSHYIYNASTNDTGNYRCAYTNTGSSDNPSPCPYNTAQNTSGTRGSQVRVLKLSNNESIWDMAGNVGEWINNTQTGTTIGPSSILEWNSSSLASGARDLYGPSSSSYLKAQGMGSFTGGALGNVFMRGGIYLDSLDAGIYSLSLSSSSSYLYPGIGFRCAISGNVLSQVSNVGLGASGAAKIIANPGSDSKIYQTMANLTTNSTYDFSAYVYNNTAGGIGGTVNASIAQLEYNGVGITTTYTNSGSGWWKLSATVTAASGSQEFGLLTKAGKTVFSDNFSLIPIISPIYTTTSFYNRQIMEWSSFSAVGTTFATSPITYQLCSTDASICESSNTWQYWNVSSSTWSNATNLTMTNTAGDINTHISTFPVTNKKIAVKIIMTYDGTNVPTLSSINYGFKIDNLAPVTNASSVIMNSSIGLTWANTNPSFTWTAATDDDPSASGIKGYCLSLSTTTGGVDPVSSKGKLGTSPVPISDNICQFIVPSNSLNLNTAGYLASALLDSEETYYLNIKAIDNVNNVFPTSTYFEFKYDSTKPRNVSYISPASGNFSNVVDMSFSWPISVGSSVSSSDSGSGILGWQYQINTNDADKWQGSTTAPELGGLKYIPSGTSSYSLVEGKDAIVSGNNVIYFRTVDKAGNFSTDATIRTGNIAFGGAAPAFNQNNSVTINPNTSTTNSFALSWPSATATNGQSVTNYYYMLNTPPPSTLATLQGNISTYINNGTATTVAVKSLPNVNKGTNTVYVVAVDSANNYSPSNYTSGTFVLDSNTPDNVSNLVSSDSSIKSQSQWNITLTWTAPIYQGAGNLIYQVYRSTDGVNFAQVGSSTGLSYVDNTPASSKYYYKVYTKDGANAVSSGTNAVSITPTGKWTTSPIIDSQPTTSSVTTKKATVNWSTDRKADSKIAFGTKSGSYNTEEPSNPTQVSSHSINLTGLSPGTTYYYRAKWTDEDGNTGTSDEKSFTTAAAPTVKDVLVKNVNLSSALVQFTSTGASKVKVYYGTSTAFGGALEIHTSTSEATYTVNLIGLLDGTKYYYKINAFDSESSEYEGTVLDFTTIPRPKISSVQLQEVAGTSQSTILVTWNTNTEISSIVTYYPEGKPEQSRDEVSIQSIKGQHKMILRGFTPETNYILVVKGRDKIGNEAVSDNHHFTTATDTRPPQISSLLVEGQNVPTVSGAAQESTAQLIVSWNTDEPATSQVEFSEGTGATYSQKTQEDAKLTYNHLVIISGLTASKVYHLKAISRDKANNTGKSIDTVTITPKATDNALNLVVSNLGQVFGFLGGFNK